MMKENCCTFFYKADKLNLEMCISTTRDVSYSNFTKRKKKISIENPYYKHFT